MKDASRSKGKGRQNSRDGHGHEMSAEDGHLLKPKKTMQQMDSEFQDQIHYMKEDEREQFHKIDSKYVDMQSFQFETQLRQIVGDCMGPVREKVILNNEQIANLLKDYEKHNFKIKQLEIIYYNMQEADDPDSGITRPISVFDSINNKIADNAATCRVHDQELKSLISTIQSKQEELMQNFEIQKLQTSTTTQSMEICNKDMQNLQKFCSTFKNEITARLNKSDNDTKIQITNLNVKQKMHADDIMGIKTNHDITRELDAKQDKMITNITENIDSLHAECERLKICKQEESSFQELRA